MAGKETRKAARKARMAELLKKREEEAKLSPEEATREMVGRQAENMDFTPDPPASTAPEVKTGPRGGKYTEAVNKEGRPYRRYFLAPTPSTST